MQLIKILREFIRDYYSTVVHYTQRDFSFPTLSLLIGFAQYGIEKCASNQTIKAMSMQLKSELKEAGLAWQQVKSDVQGHIKLSSLLNNVELKEIPECAQVFVQSKLLDQFSEEVIAQELTSLDQINTQIISTSSITEVKYSRAAACKETQDVKYGIIDFENTMTAFVTSSILACSELPKRVQLFCKWVKIMEHCLKLNNLHSTAVIMHGLRNSAIERMKMLREKLPTAVKNKLAEITELTDQSRAYRNMRSYFVNQKVPESAPRMQYKFMTLQDVCFVEEGNKNVVPQQPHNKESVPNYVKFNLLTQCIHEVTRRGGKKYNFVVNANARQALYEICNTRFPKDFDKVAYDKSLQLEPRK